MMRSTEIVWGHEVFTRIVKAAFGGTSSRRAIQVRESEAPQVLDSSWGGGSRTSFGLVALESLASLPLATQGSPFRPRVPDYVPAPGRALVEHSVFRGKDMGFRVTLHPADYTRLVADLARCTVHEECRLHDDVAKACAASGAPPCDDRTGRILASYRSLKSGPYRREALERLGVTEDDLARLIEAGWVKRNKAGAVAITAEGRAACSHVRVF